MFHTCDNTKGQLVKGIVSDSNNIILWNESEEINKKILFPKFQLIPILRFQVMHDNVWFIAPIDYFLTVNAYPLTYTYSRHNISSNTL